MIGLTCAVPGQEIKVLCIGAHCDDIEIGCGGTILTWLAAGCRLDVTWCVLSANGTRAGEAERSARAFLEGSSDARIILERFEDGFLPYEGARVKRYFETLKSAAGTPDVIFTHRRDDAHQDHREVSKLTWNTFRDHLVLEYEIPKWDGDLGQPNIYQPLTRAVAQRKSELLMAHFGTQRSKDWFDEATFGGLARLRGMECRAGEQAAEGFYLRKASLDLPVCATGGHQRNVEVRKL